MNMALYPSQEWCDKWKEAINNDAAVLETGKNWGVGFKGDLLFEVQPGSGLEKTHYVYINATEGKCSECKIVDNPSGIDAGYLVTGNYGDYKLVVKGEKDFIEMVVRGALKLKGDMGKVMRNAKFIRAVANSISSFPNEYLGE
jgi:putative sterol carrier protein